MEKELARLMKFNADFLKYTYIYQDNPTMMCRMVIRTEWQYVLGNPEFASILRIIGRTRRFKHELAIRGGHFLNTKK